MSAPTGLDLVLLFLLLVSVPAYLWFITTIIRFRKKKPFDSSFFSLCLALAAADLQCLAANFVFSRCAKFEWLGIGQLVRKYNNSMAKIFFFLYFYGCLQQFTGVALMSFNRFTAMAYFKKHEAIWRPKFTRGAILYQFLGPLLLTAPLLWFSKESYSYEIDENGQIGAITFKDQKLQLFAGILLASYLWLCNVFSAIMYGLSFWKVKKLKSTISPSLAKSNIASYARERKLSMVGVILATLMTIYGIVLMKSATATGQGLFFFIILLSVTNDALSWSNPWLCLMLSPTIRKHMIALIKCKTQTMSQHKTTHAKSHK